MANPIDILKTILWLDKHNVKNYDIKKDGRVDVLGSVRLFNKKLKEISIQFGEIKGDFDCSNNELILLKGCPQKVSGYFDCSNNKLTSLEGCPEEVGILFDCCENPTLKSLKGIKKIQCQIYSDFFKGKIDNYKGEL